MELEQAAMAHNNEIIPFILRKLVPEFNSSVGIKNPLIERERQNVGRSY